MSAVKKRNDLVQAALIVLSWVVAAILGFVAVALFVRVVLWVIR